jgi:tetratricopeptide (TPR) repeat protein/transglutaminase-like putative cysteine protease
MFHHPTRMGGPLQVERVRAPRKLRWLSFWITVFFAGLCTTAPASGSSKKEDPPIWTPGKLDPSAGLPGRWQRELEERRQKVRAIKGRSPASILPLLGAVPTLQGEVPNAELAALFDGVRQDKRRHPLVRAHGSWLRARIHEADGELDPAAKLYQGSGFLLGWQTVGPFDNANRTGHEAVYGPEQEAYAPEQTFSGKLPLEPLTWREHDGLSTARAYVSLDEFLRPNVRVTGYATTWVKSVRAQAAAIHLGTGGPYKVWVNGELAGQGDIYRHPHPLQDSHGLRLKKGWNRILVKLSVEDGVWGMYARLSEPGGGPLKGLETSTKPQSETTPASAKAGAGRKVVSLRADLEARAKAKRATADDRLDLVEFYRWVRPFADEDRTAVELAIAANDMQRSARSAWMVALLELDQNDSRTALIHGIARARREKDYPLLGTMQLELAWRYRTLGLERRARELIAEAAKTSPDDALIELARVDQLTEDGFGLAALAWVENMLQRYPQSGSLLREKAARLADLGRTREALEVLERLTAERHSDGTIVSQRVEAHLDLGELDAAVKLARRAVSAAPGVPGVYEDLARIEQATGDYRAAEKALREAIDLAPQDAKLQSKLGRVLARAGDKDASIRAFQRSLELKPQQPEIRDLLAVLDASGGDDLFARYAVDLDTLAAAFKVPKKWKGKDAGVLHHLVAVRVLPNGLSERLDHRIIRVLDERGVDSQAIQAIAYDPEESYVDVRRARVRRADGTIEEIGTPRVVSLAEAGYRMYYDQRQTLVKFQGLRVGDTLEVAFVRRDVAARNMFDEYFGDILPLQGTEPRKHVEYVLEAPADKKLYFNRKVKRTHKKGSKTAVYRYVLDDVVGIKPEASMPGWSEVADYLHVSTYETWNDVGKWYWDLISEQLLVNEEIRQGVKDTIAKLPADADRRMKVDAIYRHVIRSTRYVGLEFGIHGYKPYRTTEIYDRRFGDCKDKASLLKVMLKEVGIDSNLVLVRTRDQGELGQKPASLAGFNHAIVYVPEFDLFLDGTAEWSGPSELPTSDQGASVLIIEDGKGASFRKAPMSKASDNLQHVQQSVKLSQAGDAEVEHRLHIEGAAAAGWRIRFQSEDERKEELTKIVSRQYPHTEVVGADFPQIEEVLAPINVKAKLRVPSWAQPQGDVLRFPVLGRTSSVASGLASQARRKHDLVLTAPSQEQWTIKYELPKGMRFSQVPADKKIDSAHGSFSLDVESDGRSATVSTQLELSSHRVSPEQYRAFREFLRQVDSSLAQSFEVSDEK